MPARAPRATRRASHGHTGIPGRERTVPPVTHAPRDTDPVAARSATRQPSPGRSDTRLRAAPAAITGRRTTPRAAVRPATEAARGRSGIPAHRAAPLATARRPATTDLHADRATRRADPGARRPSRTRAFPAVNTRTAVSRAATAIPAATDRTRVRVATTAHRARARTMTTTSTVDGTLVCMAADEVPGGRSPGMKCTDRWPQDRSLRAVVFRGWSHASDSGTMCEHIG